MSKHTPGPWKAIEWATNARTTVVSDARVGRIVVAECSGQGRHTNESLADAQLIAAAPELLQEAKTVIAEFFEEYEHPDYYPENSPTIQAIKRLQAIVRKIEEAA